MLKIIQARRASKGGPRGVKNLHVAKDIDAPMSQDGPSLARRAGINIG